MPLLLFAAAREAFDRSDKGLSRYEKNWKLGLYPPPAMLRKFQAEAVALLGLQPVAAAEPPKPADRPE